MRSRPGATTDIDVAFGYGERRTNRADQRPTSKRHGPLEDREALEEITQIGARARSLILLNNNAGVKDSAIEEEE